MVPLKNTVIAIDGPAGSGKSSVARLVAERLGFLYVDSGAIYRSYTLECLRRNIGVDDEASLVNRLSPLDITIESVGDRTAILLNGEDVTEDIRSLEVTNAVSAVSKVPGVRALVAERLRELARSGPVVIEGRDIGTVVFPDADLKVFMQASLDERARRRFKELRAAGVGVEYEQVKREIVKRDKQDSEREISPLRISNEAIVFDTTNLDLEQSVAFIVKKVKEAQFHVS